jgi:hypothetical protein
MDVLLEERILEDQSDSDSFLQHQPLYPPLSSAAWFDDRKTKGHHVPVCFNCIFIKHAAHVLMVKQVLHLCWLHQGSSNICTACSLKPWLIDAAILAKAPV